MLVYKYFLFLIFILNLFTDLIYKYSDYQNYLKNHDEIMIGGKKFFLWKGETKLNALTNSDREAGTYALASLSEYIPNKVTNAQNQKFNGYNDYIQNKNGSAYMFIKISDGSAELTPSSTQAEIKQILESITW